MALPIASEEAEQLAREIAQRTGETPAQAVFTALRERPARLGRGERSDRDSAELMAKIMAIGEHCASLPVLDPRTADELLGYDECGLTH